MYFLGLKLWFLLMLLLCICYDKWPNIVYIVKSDIIKPQKLVSTIIRTITNQQENVHQSTNLFKKLIDKFFQ